uniref:Uncharacterized protein n=1 Tax=Romanomermis culicivorax TaxID=13658 RepID=A0A915L904_ROMCU
MVCHVPLSMLRIDVVQFISRNMIYWTIVGLWRWEMQHFPMQL